MLQQEASSDLHRFFSCCTFVILLKIPLPLEIRLCLKKRPIARRLSGLSLWSNHSLNRGLQWTTVLVENYHRCCDPPSMSISPLRSSRRKAYLLRQRSLLFPVFSRIASRRLWTVEAAREQEQLRQFERLELVCRMIGTYRILLPGKSVPVFLVPINVQYW